MKEAYHTRRSAALHGLDRRRMLRGESGERGTGARNGPRRSRRRGEYDPKDHLVARIYNSRNELIRKYTSETFVKQLELIAGEYRIAVEAGEAVPASFTKRFYKGEETFTVTPGETTQADVNLPQAEHFLRSEIRRLGRLGFSARTSASGSSPTTLSTRESRGRRPSRR